HASNTLTISVSCSLSAFFFFFSSRRRHTRCYRDWSSDVCSSDLAAAHGPDRARALQLLVQATYTASSVAKYLGYPAEAWIGAERSEERRVGKEWRAGWGPGT